VVSLVYWLALVVAAAAPVVALAALAQYSAGVVVVATGSGLRGIVVVAVVADAAPMRSQFGGPIDETVNDNGSPGLAVGRADASVTTR